MSEPKTKSTGQPVEEFIAAQAEPVRREECRTLCRLFEKISRAPATMWGSSIVGFDSYQYTYASGRKGTWPILGFSPRKANLTLYVMEGSEESAQILAQLGPHKVSKACLYLKHLSDIDLDILEKLATESMLHTRMRHPK